MTERDRKDQNPGAEFPTQAPSRWTTVTSWLSWPPEVKDDEAEALVVKVPGRERAGSVQGTHIQR